MCTLPLYDFGRIRTARGRDAERENLFEHTGIKRKVGPQAIDPHTKRTDTKKSRANKEKGLPSNKCEKEGPLLELITNRQTKSYGSLYEATASGIQCGHFPEFLGLGGTGCKIPVQGGYHVLAHVWGRRHLRPRGLAGSEWRWSHKAAWFACMNEMGGALVY